MKLNINELAKEFSFLGAMGFLPLSKLNSNGIGSGAAWIKPITSGSRVYCYFYITQLRGGYIRLEFLVAPEIYLGSMPELTSCCFYQKIATLEEYDKDIIYNSIINVKFLLRNEKCLEKSIINELTSPSYCTYRNIKPALTTKRHLIHLKRLDFALNSPWVDMYINSIKKNGS